MRQSAFPSEKFSLATGLNGFARQSEIWRRAKKLPVGAPDFRKTSGLRGREVSCVITSPLAARSTIAPVRRCRSRMLVFLMGHNIVSHEVTVLQTWIGGA